MPCLILALGIVGVGGKIKGMPSQIPLVHDGWHLYSVYLLICDVNLQEEDRSPHAPIVHDGRQDSRHRPVDLGSQQALLAVGPKQNINLW